MVGGWSIHDNAEISSRYQIVGHVGSGAYGDVYRAVRRIDGVAVALKEVHDYQSACREIHALLRLQHHPHVVQLFDYLWLDDTTAVLVLEFLTSDLSSVIRSLRKQHQQCLKPPPPPSETVEPCGSASFPSTIAAEIKGWMSQILAGVASCHSVRVLHRDLKPSNMLISESGVLKVADFGQARILTSNLPEDEEHPSVATNDDCQHSGNEDLECRRQMTTELHERNPSLGEEKEKDKEDISEDLECRRQMTTESHERNPLLSEEKEKDKEDSQTSSKGHGRLDKKLMSSEYKDDKACHEDEVQRNRELLKGKRSIETDEETACELASEHYYEGGLDEDSSYGHPDADAWVDSAENRNWDSSFYRGSGQASCGDDNNSLGPMAEMLSERSMDMVSTDIGFYREDTGSEYTGCVGTRWYRAPELLYGASTYGTEVDIWAVGCIFAELMLGEAIFPGCSDIDQLSRIVRVLGNPNEDRWPGVTKLPDYAKISFSIDDRDCITLHQQIKDGSGEAIDLLSKLIRYDPKSRLDAADALQHPYFHVEPLPVPAANLRVPSPGPFDDESMESL